MDDYKIETPEQVQLFYTVAGLGTRFMALAVDTLIQLALFFIAFLALAAADSRSALVSEWYLGIIITAFAVINYGYFLIFELALRGRTPGKAAMKLRVIRQDGMSADVSGIVLRNLVRLIDSLPVFYVVGVVAMFINSDSRRLGDLAAGTVVIVEGKRATLDSVLTKPNDQLNGR